MKDLVVEMQRQLSIDPDLPICGTDCKHGLTVLETRDFMAFVRQDQDEVEDVRTRCARYQLRVSLGLRRCTTKVLIILLIILLVDFAFQVSSTLLSTDDLVEIFHSDSHATPVSGKGDRESKIEDSPGARCAACLGTSVALTEMARYCPVCIQVFQQLGDHPGDFSRYVMGRRKVIQDYELRVLLGDPEGLF
jgi:hypothetical protein